MNWSCNACGMSAGRKTSVTRHIDNPNIHNGYGRAVPLETYRALSEYRTSQYKPPSRISSSPHYGSGDLRVRIEKEVENLIVKEVAKKIFDSVPKDDPHFINLEILARGHIGDKTSKGILREFIKFRKELGFVHK